MYKKMIPVSCSYTVTDEETVFEDVSPADALAASDLRKYYRASIKDGVLTLYGRTFTCAVCGEKTPAYPDFFGGPRDPATVLESYAIHLEGWARGQLDILGPWAEEKKLNTPLENGNGLKCPKCGFSFLDGNAGPDPVVESRRGKISVTAQFAVVPYHTVPEKTHNIIETLTFNLKKGKAYITLTDRGTVTPVYVRDMTGYSLRGRLPEILLRYCEPVYREVAALYEKYTGRPLPFDPVGADLRQYIKSTVFVGYDKDFYRSIPFDESGVRVERSFARAARALRFASRVPGLLKKSRLPDVKSVRKILFTYPDYLFYLPELELIWELSGDVNRFAGLLQRRTKNFYEVLAVLHSRPCVAEFLRDYVITKGSEIEKPAENGRIETRNGSTSLFSYATSYAALTENGKQAEREKWVRNNGVKSIHSDTAGPFFSRPVPRFVYDDVNSTIPDETEIDGFVFSRLCSTGEYEAAGRVLENCLRGWHHHNTDVWVIRKDGEILAAVEVFKLDITQALQAHNEEIEPRSELGIALGRWRRKYGLEFDEDFEYEPVF